MSLVTMTDEFKALMGARRGETTPAPLKNAEDSSDREVELSAEIIPVEATMVVDEPPALMQEETALRPDLSPQKLKCFGRRPFVFDGALLFSLTVPLGESGPGLTLELYESKEDTFFASLHVEDSQMPPRVYAAPSISELKTILASMDPTVFIPVPHLKLLNSNDPDALKQVQDKLLASIELSQSTFQELLSRIFGATSNNAA